LQLAIKAWGEEFSNGLRDLDNVVSCIILNKEVAGRKGEKASKVVYCFGSLFV
jgi:hypothetical protein